MDAPAPASPRFSPQDPRRVAESLRARYDLRGPRYTSYPPAPHFRELSAAEVLPRWQARNGLQPDPGLSVYLHLPFCRSRCAFCGCHALGPERAEVVDRYVAALEAELVLAQETLDPTRPVRQVAFGGGTPNFLSPAQTDRLLEALHRRLNLQADAEISVEVDARTATRDKLAAFLRGGANRFSLGIQDFDEAVLRGIRRGQSLIQVEEVADFLRAQGIQHLNFDLIYGLPGQSLASAERTAAAVLALQPSRIALYSYAHVPWLHPHQRSLEALGLPDQDLKLGLFLQLMDRFFEGGYLTIGMDHFALPGDPLTRALEDGSLRRNFMGYTTGRGLDILGLGISAISSVGSSYSQNEKGLQPYLEEVEGGGLPLRRGHLLSDDDLLRRELISELFCTFRADLDALGREFGVDCGSYFASELERLAPLEADGLLTRDAHSLVLSDTGRFFVRNVCMVFDRYIEGDPQERRYSRTV